MINFMYMVSDIITEAFTRAVGKWQGGKAPISGQPSEGKALLVLFRMKEKVVRMLIHAPMNYVGVYIQTGNLRGTEYGKWECISYHDSCWRSDGIQDFLYKSQEYIHFSSFPRTEGFAVLEPITDAILVVKLDETQLAELVQIREKGYG